MVTIVRFPRDLIFLCQSFIEVMGFLVKSSQKNVQVQIGLSRPAPRGFLRVLRFYSVHKNQHSIPFAYYMEAILESLYVTPKIFGVELATYAKFWRISKDYSHTGVG